MSDSTPPPQPPDQVHTATLTTATTGLVLWALDRSVHLPPEVYAWAGMVIPYVIGRAGASLAAWRARRRRERGDGQGPPETSPGGP